MTYHLRAINPDNAAEIRKLVDLFKTAGPGNYFDDRVFRQSFWKAQLNNNFISLIIEDESEVCAHLAIQVKGGHAEICYPFVLRERYADCRLICESFAAAVDQLVQRQNLNSLACSTCPGLEPLLRHTAEIFQLQECAFFALHPERDTSIRPYFAWKFMRFYQHCPDVQNLQSLPAQFLKIYKSCISEFSGKQTEHSVQHQQLSEQLPVYKMSSPFAANCFHFIQPALYERTDYTGPRLSEQLEQLKQQAALAICIPIEDPSTPATIQTLCELEYLCTGIFPATNGLPCFIFQPACYFNEHSPTALTGKGLELLNLTLPGIVRGSINSEVLGFAENDYKIMLTANIDSQNMNLLGSADYLKTV